MRPTTRHALQTVLRRPAAWAAAALLLGVLALTLGHPGRPPDAEGFPLPRGAAMATWRSVTSVRDHGPRVAQLEPLLDDYARGAGPGERAEVRLFADLARLPNLVAVDFGDAEATPARVRAVAGLTSLRGLGLPPRLSGRGVDLRPLAGLRRLRVLNLGGADLSPAGVEALAALPGLRALSFRQPGSLRPEVLEAVARLPALRRLELPSARDGAHLGRTLRPLRHAPSLQELRLQTQWNHDEAAAAARAAVPGVEVRGRAWAFTGLNFALMPLVLLGSLGQGLGSVIARWFGGPQATLTPGFVPAHRRAAWALVAALAAPAALTLWLFSGGTPLWPLAACLLTLWATQGPLRPGFRAGAPDLWLVGAAAVGAWVAAERTSWEGVFLHPPAWLPAALAAATLWRAVAFHRSMRPLPEGPPPGAPAAEGRRAAGSVPPVGRRVPRGLFLHPPGSATALLLCVAGAWGCAAGWALPPGIGGGWWLAGGVASTLLAFGCLTARWANEGGGLAPAAGLPVSRRDRVRRYFTRSALEFGLLVPPAAGAAAWALLAADPRAVRAASGLPPGPAAAWLSLLLGTLLLAAYAATTLRAARPRLALWVTAGWACGLFAWLLLDLQGPLTPKLVATSVAAAAAVPGAYAAHLRKQWGAAERWA